jgi:N6-L-threonylcarbamoyladenine synthase
MFAGGEIKGQHLVLGIETSCDDTAVALVDTAGGVRGSLFSHQNTSHEAFGGVVPEIASRRHTEELLPILDQLLTETSTGWKDISAIAVTSRPGLIGSLLVGVVAAKTLSLSKKIPLIGVNHIEGHLLAPFLRDDKYAPPTEFGFPFLGLAVSGGHTHLFMVHEPGRYELLGKTRDDAAGEAYDKFAKLIGLGFPGGVRVDKEAASGNPKAFAFPRSLLSEDSLDFSFSGLKSSAGRRVADWPKKELEAKRADLCASYQAAINEVLIAKMDRAHAQFPEVKSVTITGGVSANSDLRKRAEAWATQKKLTLALPPLRFCTDNAAMIARAGAFYFERKKFSDQTLSPSAQSLTGDFT